MPTFSKGIVVTVTFLEAFIPTAIEDEREEESLKVFPNPTNGDISVEFIAQNESKVELILSDISGKTITTQLKDLIPNQKNTLNLSLKNANLSSGVYFLKIRTNKHTLDRKLTYLSN